MDLSDNYSMSNTYHLQSSFFFLFALSVIGLVLFWLCDVAFLRNKTTRNTQQQQQQKHLSSSNPNAYIWHNSFVVYSSDYSYVYIVFITLIAVFLLLALVVTAIRTRDPNLHMIDLH